MAIAETARLITELSLRDQLTPGLGRASGALNGLQAATRTAGRGFSGLSTLAGGASNALSTFKGRIGSIISGPLGLLGLGAAAFGVGRIISDGVQQARDFGREVGLLARVTGLTTEKTSELAGAFEHFGISSDTALRLAGFAEKNLFRLGGTAQAAKDFQDKYGLALVDSSGKLKDFNTLLLDSSDFFLNKNVPAAQKAAGLAQIYGRNWQAIIPILSAGRDTIAEVEDEAKKLGLTLTDQNLNDLVKLRDATRDWNTALGGLKLQLGLAIVPALTDLTAAATSFLANGGREQIVGFFKNVIAFAQEAGHTVNRDVIPVFKGIYGAWQAVPSELRDLIIKGFAADRVIKFLFGFSPASLVIQGLERLIGSKFIPQLVTVTNPGFGGPGRIGGPSGPNLPVPPVAGPLGILGTAGAVAFAASGIALAIIRQQSGDPPVAGGGKLGFFPTPGGRSLFSPGGAARQTGAVTSAAVREGTAPLVSEFRRSRATAIDLARLNRLTPITINVPVTVNLNASLLQSKIFQLRKAAALTKAGIF